MNEIVDIKALERIREIMRDACPLYYKAIIRSCIACPFIEKEECLIKQLVHPMMPGWEFEAIEYARHLHQGQLDDEGKDYFNAHILQVVHLIKMVSDDQTLITAAYLHDTIENTTLDCNTLRDKFGNDVLDLVMEVTKEGQNYFPRLKTQKGIVLKFADRLSNISRMNAWDDNRKQNYLDRSKFWKGMGDFND